MRILFAAAEVDPFSKVGGLADVAAALPRRLAEIGHDVRVVTPAHPGAVRAGAAVQTRTVEVKLPGGGRPVSLHRLAGAGGVPVDLVDDPHYFNRAQVYGEPDDLLRYQFFCRCVVAMLEDEPWTPDVVHLNDWHTAPLAFALRSLAWDNPRLRGTASVFTIHNLRYRGPDPYNDFLAQGIYYSDAITTVSPTYAREILTREYGEGLDSLLSLREADLRGILNGLDYDTFNPRHDPALAAPFDLTSLDARGRNRAALRAEVGLPEEPGPVMGAVARLTEQKGLDLLARVAAAIVEAGAQLVVLGQGDDALEQSFAGLAAAHPRHIRFIPRFHEGFARQIYGGSDVFIMPSRYEPCGLGQLIAMHYGSVPVVRRTGGLADTVTDIDEHPETANGFVFDEFSSFALEAALRRACVAFRNKGAWRRLQSNGMSRDYSWRASAARYVDVYGAALRKRGIIPLT